MMCLVYWHAFYQVNTTLNTRDEYFNACPHKKKYLLLKGLSLVTALTFISYESAPI